MTDVAGTVSASHDQGASESLVGRRLLVIGLNAASWIGLAVVLAAGAYHAAVFGGLAMDPHGLLERRDRLRDFAPGARSCRLHQSLPSHRPARRSDCHAHGDLPGRSP